MLPETTAALPMCPEVTAPEERAKLLTVPDAMTPEVTCPLPRVAVLIIPEAM